MLMLLTIGVMNDVVVGLLGGRTRFGTDGFLSGAILICLILNYFLHDPIF